MLALGIIAFIAGILLVVADALGRRQGIQEP
jgi:hypothetical protein